MDTHILEQMGFTKQEIALYIALLRLGSSTASRLSKETGMDRATCYRHLDTLQAKGAVSQVTKKNVKHFQGTNPKKLLEDLQENERSYKELLPSLIELSRTPRDDTEVQLYTGKEGLKTVLRELIRNKEDYEVLGDEGHFMHLMEPFFRWFIRQCKKHRIKERILCSKDTYPLMKELEYAESETRMLPSKEKPPITTVITKERVILFDWTEPYHAIVIKNTPMAKAYKHYFSLLWKQATIV